jgi:phage terminase large subunit-like protein
MEIKTLSKKQLQNTIQYVDEIINNLSDKAIQELMSGYGKDVDKLFNEILIQTSDIINFNESSINSEKLSYLTDLEISFDEQLKRVSYNYFKTTCLPNFHQGWRNLEWGNLIQMYPYLLILASRSHGKSYESCMAFPLWRLYTYEKLNFYQQDTVDNKNRKETLMITNTSTLGSEHIDKIVEEIKFNDLIADKLNPTNKASLGSTGITTETGSKLHLRGIGGFFRGLHCGAVVGDDIPDESSIYSQEQRDKLESKFYGGITPIVEPNGHLLMTGTPFSSRDIYWKLKNDPRFVCFEYPAIFQDGTLLSPDRFTFDKLMEERESLGSLIFSREYLVVPISDDATIFPFEILMRSTIGMENIDLVDNLESYPFKLVRKVIGCDFAKSANVGADYTVYSVWGCDEMDNYYLLHLWRKRGASHNEQISQIVSLDQRFKPNKIVCEANGFQGMLSDMARQRGIKNIQEFTTTGANKKNWYDGLPSLAALYERGQIKIPYKEGKTRETSDIIFQEFNSVSFRPDKGTLESVSGHDDCCMSCYFALTDLRENKSQMRSYWAG